MTDEQKIYRIQALLMKLHDVEQECVALGLHTSAQLIGGVKNGVGWGFAKLMQDGAAVSGAGEKS